jgi:hypothetical protein
MSSFNDVMRFMLPPRNGVNPHITSGWGSTTRPPGTSNPHLAIDFNYLGGQRAPLNQSHREVLSGGSLWSRSSHREVALRRLQRGPGAAAQLRAFGVGCCGCAASLPRPRGVARVQRRTGSVKWAAKQFPIARQDGSWRTAFGW